MFELRSPVKPERHLTGLPFCNSFACKETSSLMPCDARKGSLLAAALSPKYTPLRAWMGYNSCPPAQASSKESIYHASSSKESLLVYVATARSETVMTKTKELFKKQDFLWNRIRSWTFLHQRSGRHFWKQLLFYTFNV